MRRQQIELNSLRAETHKEMTPGSCTSMLPSFPTCIEDMNRVVKARTILTLDQCLDRKELIMAEQEFDATRYKSAQRQEWDAVAVGWSR